MSVEEELDHSLKSLLRISNKLNSTFDLDRLLNTLLEQVVLLTRAESGCVGLRTATGMVCSHFLQGARPVSFSQESTAVGGWPGWVLTHGTCYVTNDALNDNVISPEIRRRFDVKSGMSIPILDNKRDVIAWFEVYNKTSALEFTPLDIENSLAAAEIASLAIQNSLTYEKLIALAVFSRSLKLASDLEEVLEIVGHHFETTFQRGSVVLLPAEETLFVRFRTSEFALGAKELKAARWCWEHVTESGAGTPTFSDSLAYWLPLTVRRQVIGVLGLESKPGAWFSAIQRELLSGLVGQSALAIERGLLEQRVRRIRFLNESDRLQNALLTAVSHEVRAPLAAITAAVSGLLNDGVPLDRALERKLLRTAGQELKRLHRLVNNLLSVTRLEAGVSRVKLEPSDFADVLSAALEELETGADKRQVIVEIPEDLPLISMDFELITQVLVNLLSNAFKFSRPDHPVLIRSRVLGDKLEVAVVDRGIGIAEGDLDRAFQKFRRLAESHSAEGLGLGLSICKEFVEAHRGSIRLEQNPEGGTIAKFLLPVASAPTFV